MSETDEHVVVFGRHLPDDPAPWTHRMRAYPVQALRPPVYDATGEQVGEVLSWEYGPTGPIDVTITMRSDAARRLGMFGLGEGFSIGPPPAPPAPPV